MPQLSFQPKATVCKYAVPDGYPTDPESGAKVTIDAEVVASAVRERATEQSSSAERSSADHSSGQRPRDNTGEALLYYASVDDREDGIYTTTSRSYAVVGVDDTIEGAEAIAEDALQRAGTEGLRVRHDIGKPDLVQQRLDHMAEIRGE